MSVHDCDGFSLEAKDQRRTRHGRGVSLTDRDPRQNGRSSTGSASSSGQGLAAATTTRANALRQADAEMVDRQGGDFPQRDLLARLSRDTAPCLSPVAATPTARPPTAPASSSTPRCPSALTQSTAELAGSTRPRVVASCIMASCRPRQQHSVHQQSLTRRRRSTRQSARARCPNCWREDELCRR